MELFSWQAKISRIVFVMLGAQAHSQSGSRMALVSSTVWSLKPNIELPSLPGLLPILLAVLLVFAAFRMARETMSYVVRQARSVVEKVEIRTLLAGEAAVSTSEWSLHCWRLTTPERGHAWCVNGRCLRWCAMWWYCASASHFSLFSSFGFCYLSSFEISWAWHA